jgi:hypothetical protein
MVKVILQVSPQEVYSAFDAKLKEVTDTLVRCLMDNDVFDSEQQARDWATVQVYNGLKKLAKEEGGGR